MAAMDFLEGSAWSSRSRFLWSGLEPQWFYHIAAASAGPSPPTSTRWTQTYNGLEV